MKVSIVSKRDYPEISLIKRHFDVVKKGAICIALGGDGTFVHAAMKYDVPILPIRVNENMSSGFYSDLSTKDLPRIIEGLKEHEYDVKDAANKLRLSFNKKEYFAVNEISLNHIKQEVSFRVFEKNKERRRIFPFVVAGDGVVVTGEIGSTAYNRSAMGPILLSNKVMCVTFLNTDGPYRNSLVVDSGSVIEIEIAKYNGMLRYDGIDAGIVNEGDAFSVSTSDRILKIVKMRFKKETLGEKMERIMKRRMER